MAGYAEFPRSPFFIGASVVIHLRGMNPIFDRRLQALSAACRISGRRAPEEPQLLLPAGAALRRRRGAHRDRRSGARYARRQPHRSALHGRSCRHIALPHAIQIWACHRARSRLPPMMACKLQDARITNSVKCLPPANKPLPAEIKECNAYLREELRAKPEVPASFWRWVRSRMRPCCGRTICPPASFVSRMAQSMSWPRARCCWIPIIAAATTRRRGD